jgi:hypothetical protein
VGSPISKSVAIRSIVYPNAWRRGSEAVANPTSVAGPFPITRRKGLNTILHTKHSSTDLYIQTHREFDPFLTCPLACLPVFALDDMRQTTLAFLLGDCCTVERHHQLSLGA